MTVKTVPIKSGAIAEASLLEGETPIADKIRVVFHNGRVYEYRARTPEELGDDPPDQMEALYYAMVNAESVNGFFQRYIRPLPTTEIKEEL